MGTIMELSVNLVQTLILTWFISSFFGYKKEGVVRVIGFVGVWILAFVETSFINAIVVYDGFLSGIVILTYILYAVLFMQGSFWKKVFISILSMAVVFTIGSVNLLTFSFLSGKNIGALIADFDGWRFAIIIIGRLIEYIVFRVIVKVNHDYHLSTKDWMMFICLPLLTWVTVTMTMNIAIMEETLLPQMFYISIIMLMISIAIIWFLLKIKQDAEAKMEYRLLKQQHDTMKKTEQNMKALYESTHAVKHDMEKHLLAVKIMAEHGDAAKIFTYVNQIMEECEKNAHKAVFTENDIFNAVMNTRLQICKEKKILIHIQIESGVANGLKPEIVTVVLGNLLDNAIEAAEQAEEKIIYFKMFCREKHILLSIQNSFDYAHSDTLLSSTKKNKEVHGFGLKNAKKVIEQENGVLQISVDEEGLFCVEVMLS